MKGLVLVLTYNESANIQALVDRILSLGLNVEVLVVDDNSPDGTGDIVAQRAGQDRRIHLLSRSGPRGRGLAGIEGFRRATQMPVDYVVEMDADFSHDPDFIPHFLPALENADVVLASRLVPGGQQPGRGWGRKLLTRAACWWARFWLGLSVKDATSGFRCFRNDILKKVDWDKMVSEGPSIVEEVLWALDRAGARIVEIPLVFLPRLQGNSQLNVCKLFRAFCLVSSFRFKSPPINN